MKTFLTCCAALLAIELVVTAADLAFVGKLPELPPQWKLREQGKYGDATFRWDWIVFTNTQDEVLSLASHRREPGEERALIYWSDTAHESFCDGSPMWTRTSGNSGIEVVESIRNSVVTLDMASSSGKRSALEFSFITARRGTNSLAHGYAFAVEDVVVLVQHLSRRPIASEFVRGLAVSLAAIEKQ